MCRGLGKTAARNRPCYISLEAWGDWGKSQSFHNMWLRNQGIYIFFILRMFCSGQDHLKARGMGRNHPHWYFWSTGIVCSTAFLPQQKCSYAHNFGKKTIIEISIHFTAPCWPSGRTFLLVPIGSKIRSGAQNITWRLFSKRMHEHIFSRCWEKQVKKQQYRLFPPEDIKKYTAWP